MSTTVLFRRAVTTYYYSRLDAKFTKVEEKNIIATLNTILYVNNIFKTMVFVAGM